MTKCSFEFVDFSLASLQTKDLPVHISVKVLSLLGIALVEKLRNLINDFNVTNVDDFQSMW